MNAKLKVGILGLGTVGSGVLHILKEHQEKISQVTGYKLEIKSALVRHIEKYENQTGIILTTDADTVLNDPEIDIIVEVMGGIDTSKDYILQALNNKKHVVTANKDLIALHGNELTQVAKENHCDLYYEASVAGGIPILRTLVDSLAADNIKKVMGIVNGTTNFMLTKMAKNDLSYEAVLAEAQALGFAEADPTNDVDGIDSARKMVILSRLAFGMNLPLSAISTNGIRTVTAIDIQIAKQLGYTIKLIGAAEEQNGTIHGMVGPMLLPNEHPLAGVNNENNAVFVTGASVGETMFYGPGAGELPTATSVVSDLITIAKNIRMHTTGDGFSHYQHETKLTLKQDIQAKYYLRLNMTDKTGTFLKLTQLFAAHHIGFEQIIQQPFDQDSATVVIITHQGSKQQLDQAIDGLKSDTDMDLKARFDVLEESVCTKDY